jgi:two-component system, NarL family, invasion response regulator UvrY
MSIIQVLLVDDHEVVLSGYRRLLENAGDIKVIDEARDGAAAYVSYIEHQPDVVVMDISMPGMGGLEAARKILQRDPNAHILIFSVHETEVFLNRALEDGVLGYITKRSAAKVMVDAVRHVAKGEVYVGQELVGYLVRQKNTPTDDTSVLERLSPREFEIFLMLAEGKPATEIADILNLSTKTISHHYTSIKNKLNASNVVDLTRLAIRHRLLEP